jgi:hypothetical protein
MRGGRDLELASSWWPPAWRRWQRSAGAAAAAGRRAAAAAEARAAAGVSVATDPSGNIFVTGTFSGTMTLDPPCGAVAAKGVADLFVIKLDTAGACQWVRTFGVAAQSQVAKAIAVDQTGNVAITGQAIDAIDFGGGAHTYKGGGDIFVAKLNPTSNYLWSKLYGDASAQVGTDLAFEQISGGRAAGSRGTQPSGTGTGTGTG